MIETKTYVYGILDCDDSIVYVGKSSCPNQRMRWHKNNIKYNKCKILDIFYDTENFWINKLKLEGCQLENKYDIPCEEEWNIGDIIEVGSLKRIKIKDTNSGKIYETLKDLSDEIGIERNTLKYRIDSKTIETPYIYV
jgi:hypothetical protein